MCTCASRRPNNDSGAVAVIVAILIVVFIGLTALVVDVGYWYNVRRQLQTAADSAALAGAAELQATHSADLAFGVAKTYALKNSAAPGDGLQVIERGSGSGAAVSEVGSNYVLITVRKAAPTFFSGIFGGGPGYIYAQSRAELQWIYGMKGLVPLALPILAMPSKITVNIGGAGERMLSKGADGDWHAYGVPVGSAGAGASEGVGNKVTVAAYNSQNVPVAIDDAARVVVRQANCPITDLTLSRYYAPPGDVAGITGFVTSTKPLTDATIGKNGTATGITDLGGNRWRFFIPVPSTTDPYLSSTLEVVVDKKKNAYTLSDAATVVSRQSTFPIGDVSLSAYVVSVGSTVDVTVKLNDYEYGELYELRISDGWGDVGNYMQLNLSEVFHPPNMSTPEYDLGSNGASAYEDFLGAKFPYVIHIGDVIYTKPGDQKNATADGLEARGIRNDTRTFAQWVAAGSPPDWPRVTYVPVVELYGDKGGRRPVIVKSFGTFYIESAYNDEILRGRFIKYVGPGDVAGDAEPSDFGVLTPRLVPTGISF